MQWRHTNLLPDYTTTILETWRNHKELKASREANDANDEEHCEHVKRRDFWVRTYRGKREKEEKDGIEEGLYIKDGYNSYNKKKLDFHIPLSLCLKLI